MKRYLNIIFEITLLAVIVVLFIYKYEFLFQVSTLLLAFLYFRYNAIFNIITNDRRMAVQIFIEKYKNHPINKITDIAFRKNKDNTIIGCNIDYIKNGCEKCFNEQNKDVICSDEIYIQPHLSIFNIFALIDYIHPKLEGISTNKGTIIQINEKNNTSQIKKCKHDE